MRVAILLMLMSAALPGAPLGGPAPGYVLDARTHSIRPILGIPGALQFGTPWSLPFGVVSAGFDPAGNFAIAVSDEKPAHVYQLQTGGNAGTVDFGPVADGSAVLAVNAVAAVLTAPGQVQFVVGNNASPVLSPAIPTAALLGPVTAGAVDDAGQCALLGTAVEGSGALETLCADGSSRRIFSRDGMNIAAISLANGGQDAILADRTGQQVLRVTGYSANGAVSVVAAASDGLSAPVGVQVNGQQVFIADAGVPAIFVADLGGAQALQTVALNVAPARLTFLTDRSILTLNDLAAENTGLFTVLDVRAMQSFFVPTN